MSTFVGHVGYSTSLMKPRSRSRWTSTFAAMIFSSNILQCFFSWFCQRVDVEFMFHDASTYACQIGGGLGQNVIVLVQEVQQLCLFF
jgi:hypothetical protein